MKYLLILVQTDYESWGLKSVLIATVIALGGVIGYLYKSKERALKEKDDKIMQIIKEHQADLKEANQDMKTFVEKYHQFTQQLKEVVNARGLSR